MKLILSRRLLDPSYLICGVGTSIYDVKARESIKDFSQVLEEGWNINKVEDVMANLKLDIEKQPDYLQNEYKSSWYLHSASTETIRNIESKLTAAVWK